VIGFSRGYRSISATSAIALVGAGDRAGDFPVREFLEWWIHRFVMHRPSQVKAFRAIYNRHTLMHHQFFTEKEMRFGRPQWTGA